VEQRVEQKRMESLPDELLIAVFELLKPRDLMTMSWVDQRIREVARDRRLWRACCRRAKRGDRVVGVGEIMIYVKKLVHRVGKNTEPQLSKFIIAKRTKVYDFVPCLVYYGVVRGGDRLFSNFCELSKSESEIMPRKLIMPQQLTVSNGPTFFIDFNYCDRGFGENFIRRCLWDEKMTTRELARIVVYSSRCVIFHGTTRFQPSPFASIREYFGPHTAIQFQSQISGVMNIYIPGPWDRRAPGHPLGS
jgi:F-box-like